MGASYAQIQKLYAEDAEFADAFDEAFNEWCFDLVQAHFEDVVDWDHKSGLELGRPCRVKVVDSDRCKAWLATVDAKVLWMVDPESITGRAVADVAYDLNKFFNELYYSYDESEFMDDERAQALYKEYSK